MINPQLETDILLVLKELETELLPSYEESKQAVYNGRLKQNPKRTLEDIGNEQFLVRERVRQIEDDLREEIKKQLNSRINLEQAINAIFSEYGKLLPINTKKLTSEDAKILEGVFQKGYTFYISPSAGVIAPDKEVINTLRDKILSAFPTDDDIKAWSYNEIYSIVETKIKKFMFRQCTPELCSHLTSNVTNFIVSEYFTSLAPSEGNNYLLKEGKKRVDARKLEYFFRKLYRSGVSIPQQKEDEIESNLIQLKEALPEFSWAAKHLKNKILDFDKVVWWNDGTYIHLDNCSIDSEILDDVIEKSQELFKLGVNSFEARVFFDLYARKLVAKGVPNHLALYSLLEKKNDNRIRLVENKRTLLTISNPDTTAEIKVADIPRNFFNQEELLKYPEAESNFRNKKSENCALSTDENIELQDTERDAVIKSRITQGKFRDDLISKYHKCALCDVADPQLLIASHIKPWGQSKLNPKERNDVENGILLCSWHDALFDKGYISFDDDGSVIISAKLENIDFSLLNIDTTKKLELSSRNKKYLQHHRQANSNKLVPFVKY